MVQKTMKLVVEQKTVVWFKRRGSLWSNRGQLYGSKDDEVCGRIEDSCMVQKTRELVVENRGQLFGSKDDEACGRTEDSCMVQKTRELVVEQRTIVWFKRR